MLRKEDVLAYARRDWAAFERMKRERQVEQMSRMQPADALEVGDALRHHAQALHPDWPTEDDRRKDLAVHLRVSESLRSVAATKRR
jgi:hypothetical protein